MCVTVCVSLCVWRGGGGLKLIVCAVLRYVSEINAKKIISITVTGICVDGQCSTVLVLPIIIVSLFQYLCVCVCGDC